MAKHDYDFPSDWDKMTDEEKSRWYTQERCRRQAMRQDTPAGRALRRQAERAEQYNECEETQSPQDTESQTAEGYAA